MKLNLTETTNLAFEMIVEGTANRVDTAWVVIETNNGFDVRVPAIYENNQIRCIVPSMESILTNGSTTVHLEVVVDGRYFRPLSEEVQIGNGQQEIRIITKQPTSELATEAKKPSTFSQLGTPPKTKKSAHRTEVEKKSKEYYDSLPEPEIKNSQIGNAKITKEETFDESLEQLDKLKNKYSPPTGSVVDEFQFGKKFEEKYSEMTKESSKRIQALRESAKQFVEGLAPNNSAAEKAEMNKLKALLSSKHK